MKHDDDDEVIITVYTLTILMCIIKLFDTVLSLCVYRFSLQKCNTVMKVSKLS